LLQTDWHGVRRGAGMCHKWHRCHSPTPLGIEFLD
jgi:hypothetical protein